MYLETKEAEFKDLKGATIHSIIINDNKENVTLNTTQGTYIMYHRQDCCESVELEDVVGDLEDIIGTPVLMAEERVSENKNPDDMLVKDLPEYQDSFTWTFYEIATVKGSVTLRWYGESNGYYSESVEFFKI